MKTRKLEKGKHYQQNHMFFRVDDFDHTDDPIGVLICFFDGHVDVTKDTDLFYLTLDEASKEITKEEFEARLYQSQRELAKLCLEIKSK